jgi:hypothetical protein
MKKGKRGNRETVFLRISEIHCKKILVRWVNIKVKREDFTVCFNDLDKLNLLMLV